MNKLYTASMSSLFPFQKQMLANLCNYCGPERKSLPKDSYSIHGNLSEYNNQRLEINTADDSGNLIINYCPMCGKKLDGSSSTEHAYDSLMDTSLKNKLCPCGGKLVEVDKGRYYFSGQVNGITYSCDTCGQWWVEWRDNNG